MADQIGKGTVLGDRYRLERAIGTGGMASVWLARDERLGRDVAVKVLADNLVADRGYAARFRREARLADRVSHPNLVPVFDYGGRRERPYLVMEHVDGPTLAQLMRRRGRRRPDQVRLARELLDALVHIHAAGIVHRDVKPQNVLIDRAGRARLTDFGIALPEDGTNLTRTGDVIGTMPYIAPEVAEGGKADERADLYSLGVLLRECAGRRPTPHLAALIERLTAADPDARLGSASEARDLLDATPVTGVSAPPTAPTRVARPVPAPHQARGGGALAAAAGAVLGKRLPAEQRRKVAAAAAIGIVALAIGLLLALDQGDGGGATQLQSPPQQAQEPPAAQPQPQPESTLNCAALEEQRKRLEEERKAAEERVKDDEEAKKRVEEQFKAREERLKAQEDACKGKGNKGKGKGNGNGDDNGGPGGDG